MHLFYAPDVTPGTYTFPEEESKHAIRVLRLKTGDAVRLVDGKGGMYDATIIDDHQKHCTVSIIATFPETGKRSWQLHIAIAPTKSNDRTEWFVEKATEMGIDMISLIDCANSERSVAKTERLQKVAISAMKQSMKAYLPAFQEIMDLKKFIAANAGFPGEKFIAHCVNREALPHLKMLYTPQQNALILIGPEGDFTEEEVKLAVENGFKGISMGSSRLRTETAAMYACAVVNIVNEGKS